MVEDQHPDKVKPAEDRNDQAEDKTKDVLASRLFEDRGDADDDFSDPTNDRDEEEDELNKAGLLIEPFHESFSFLNFLNHKPKSVLFHIFSKKKQKSLALYLTECQNGLSSR